MSDADCIPGREPRSVAASYSQLQRKSRRKLRAVRSHLVRKTSSWIGDVFTYR